MATLQTTPQGFRAQPHKPSPGWLAYRKLTNLVFQCLCVLATAVAVAALGFVLFYLLREGISSLHPSIFTHGTQEEGFQVPGLRDAIVGTLILVGIGCCIGLPLGILGGVYQIEARGPFAATVRFLTDVLNSIPSIVIGIFVYVMVVLPTARAHPGSGFSAIAGGTALGMLMVPTVMRTTEEILRLVPNTMREASLALGAARWRTMVSIVLPAARGGIITGVMLALSRIAGETAPLLFTTLGSTWFNVNVTKQTDALPLRIYYNAIAPDNSLNALAHAGAILLIGLIFVMSVAARMATRGGMIQEK